MTTISNYNFKKLERDDFEMMQRLIALFQKEFEMSTFESVSDEYLSNLLKNPLFVVLVAMQNDSVVGGLTAFELPKYYNQRSELFIYDIAVTKAHQRKGLGKQLLLEVNNYCKLNNINELFVAANEEDSHALDFYRSAGGKPER